MAKIKIDPKKAEALNTVTAYLESLKVISDLLARSKENGLEVRTGQDKKDIVSYAADGTLYTDIDKALKKEAARLTKLITKIADQYDIELDENETPLLSIAA